LAWRWAREAVLAAGKCSPADGRFTLRLEAPEKLPESKLYVRVYAATDDTEAMTVVPVKVRSRRKR